MLITQHPYISIKSVLQFFFINAAPYHGSGGDDKDGGGGDGNSDHNCDDGDCDGDGNGDGRGGLNLLGEEGIRDMCGFGGKGGDDLSPLFCCTAYHGKCAFTATDRLRPL